MSRKQFFIQLAGITVFTILATWLIHQNTTFQAHQNLSWIGLALFFVISILMYIFGYQAAQSSSKNQFTTTVMGFTMGKIFLSLILIFGYNSLVEPKTKLFILPFFGIYAIFTIFETYFMMKLGKMNT